MKRFTAMLSLVLMLMVLPAASQDKVHEGMVLLDQGKADEAAALFQKAVDLNPRNTAAMNGLAKAQLQGGKPALAEATAKNALLVDDKNAETWLLLAQAQMSLGHKADAYTTLRKAIKPTKNNPELLVQLGWLHLSADSTSQAEIAFSQAKQQLPKNPEIYRGLGEAYLKLGAEPVALMQFEESIKYDTVQVELRAKMADLYLKDRRYNEAAQMYRSVLNHDPENDKAALEVSRIYMLSKQYKNATSYLESYVLRHPEDQATWSTYMEALDKSRQYQSALSAAEHLLKNNPNDPLALRLAGKANFMLKQYQPAVDAYTKLVAVDTLGYEDAKRLGKSYYALKNDSLALRYMEVSLAKNPDQDDLYNDMGASYMRTKQWEKAAEMYQNRIKADSTYPNGYINFALCKMAMADFQPATAALRKATALRPNYVAGYLYLGRALRGADSLRAARQAYETMASLADSMKNNYKNELGEAYTFITFSYLVEKNNSQALGAVTKAIEFKPNDVELNLWRAQILHALDRREEAKTQYEKVMRLDPKNADAKKGLDILQLYN